MANVTKDQSTAGSSLPVVQQRPKPRIEPAQLPKRIRIWVGVQPAGTRFTTREVADQFGIWGKRRRQRVARILASLRREGKLEIDRAGRRPEWVAK